MKKNWINSGVLRARILALSSMAVVACSKDDEGMDDGEASGNVLKGEIAENKTIEGEWSLDGLVTVKKGVTLTIKAGAKITALVKKDDQIDILVIAQDAKLMANGTAASPIVFTSDAAEEKTKAGKPVLNGDAWGGIVVNGRAQINTGDTGTGEYAPTGTYGGADDADSSGEFVHITLKYPGFSFAAEKQLNGFSFYAVGSGTKLDHLTVLNGFDDGIEFFGGKANLTNARVEEVVDDAYDWTDGFTGTITNAVAVLGDASDKGIEGDNNSKDNIAIPISNPKIKNMTIYGKEGSKKDKKAINVREGSYVQLEDIKIFDVKTALDFDNDATWRDLGKVLSKSKFKNVNIDKDVAKKIDIADLSKLTGDSKTLAENALKALTENAEIKTDQDVTK